MRKKFPTIDSLTSVIHTAWSHESSGSWTTANPAKGQCSVTALVVEELFGGKIVTTKTTGGTHFYNLLDGVRHDLTACQFSGPIEFDDLPSDRAEAMADTSPRQLAALRARLGIGK